ncbi:hypothetical protein ACGF3G_51045, partial [Streptomyces sp. NPDC048179]
DPDQMLYTFLADPGSPSDEALTVLSTWAAQHAPGLPARAPDRHSPPRAARASSPTSSRRR